MGEVRFGITSLQARHIKSVSNLLGFVGELGGVANLLFVVAVFFLSPIAQYNFNLVTFGSLFKVKSKGKNEER